VRWVLEKCAGLLRKRRLVSIILLPLELGTPWAQMLISSSCWRSRRCFPGHLPNSGLLATLEIEDLYQDWTVCPLRPGIRFSCMRHRKDGGDQSTYSPRCNIHGGNAKHIRNDGDVGSFDGRLCPFNETVLQPPYSQIPRSPQSSTSPHIREPRLAAKAAVRP
jgi:hypothetical protein